MNRKEYDRLRDTVNAIVQAMATIRPPPMPTLGKRTSDPGRLIHPWGRYEAIDDTTHDATERMLFDGYRSER